MRFLQNKNINQRGFTFIETMVYVFVMTVILMTITSLFINIFNARKQAMASYRVYNDARFIANFLHNRLRNVELIEDFSQSQYIFYDLPDKRFDIFVDQGRLFYRQTENLGQGFPEQSAGAILPLSSEGLIVEDLLLTAISDSQGNSHQGIKIDFILTTGQPSDAFGYKSKPFSIYISLR